MRAFELSLTSAIFPQVIFLRTYHLTTPASLKICGETLWPVRHSTIALIPLCPVTASHTKEVQQFSNDNLVCAFGNRKRAFKALSPLFPNISQAHRLWMVSIFSINHCFCLFFSILGGTIKLNPPHFLLLPHIAGSVVNMKPGGVLQLMRTNTTFYTKGKAATLSGAFNRTAITDCAGILAARLSRHGGLSPGWHGRQPDAA